MVFDQTPQLFVKNLGFRWFWAARCLDWRSNFRLFGRFLESCAIWRDSCLKRNPKNFSSDWPVGSLTRIGLMVALPLAI